MHIASYWSETVESMICLRDWLYGQQGDFFPLSFCWKSSDFVSLVVSCNHLTNFVFLALLTFFFSIALVLMLVRHNLDDLCWDVMNMKPHNDERSSLASKSEASSRVGLKYALEN